MPPSTPLSEDLLDARQLAKRLNVTVPFVRRKTSEGKIPARKLGHRTIRYDLTEVLRVFERQEPPPPPKVRRPVSHNAPVLLSDLPHYDWSSSPNSTLSPATHRA